jgi:ubiquinone biosynthesis protein UbiJ
MMQPPFSGTDLLIIKPLSAGLNHLLANESWARALLQPHAGKRVRLRVAELSITLAVAEDGLLAQTSQDGDTDVTLTLEMHALAPLANAAVAGDVQNAALRHVHLEGDAELAQAVGKLAQYLRWDVEEDLSRLVGDAAAYRISAGARQAAKSARDIVGRMTSSAVEYLTEEQAVITTGARAQLFTRDVQRLREDLERLEKRVRKLQV